MTIHITPLDVAATFVVMILLSRDFRAKLVVNERVFSVRVNWLGWALALAAVGLDVAILRSQTTDKPIPYVWISVDLPRQTSSSDEL